VDDIPIVRLDDLPEGESADIRWSIMQLIQVDQPIDQPSKTDTTSKTKKKPKPPPPQFDRSGEMPEDANPNQPPVQPEQTIVQGLAGVDLLSDIVDSRPTSKYEEYNADGDEEPRRTDMADEPVGGEIEVVKVKRKKKKDGSKKRADV
jgi:hypothetical protein